MKLTLFISLFLITSYAYAQESCTAEFLFNTEYNPRGLATDGKDFWVSERDGLAYHISIYDQSGNRIDSIFYVDASSSLDSVLGGLELQEDTLWAIDEQGPLLYKLNKWTGEIYTIFDLPTFNNSDPNNWGIAYDGTYLWNVEYGISGSIEPSIFFKINPLNGDILDTLMVASNVLLPLEIIEDKMLAVNRDLNELYEVDLTSGELTYLMDWCLDSAYDIAFHYGNGLFGASGASQGTQSINKILGVDLPVDILVPENDTGTIEIMPNPTSEILRVYCENMENGTIMIFDALGKLCLTDRISNHSFEKNISQLNSGVYYLHLNDNKKIAVRKFVKAE